MKLHNDVVRSIDDGDVTGLALLDLSAAFDTVDHDILLNVLELRYGIVGPALGWFESYLRNRTQTVIYNGQHSQSTTLSCGVPQG